MRLVIHHSLNVHYRRFIREHQCELRIAPRDDASQRLVSLSITVEPPAEIRQRLDWLGNPTHSFTLLAPHDRLTVSMDAVVETLTDNPFAYTPLEPEQEGAWVEETLRKQPRLLDYLLHRSSFTPDALADAPEQADGQALLARATEAMAWVNQHLSYDSALDGRPASLDTVLTRRTGGAEDYAHLLITLIRQWGFPARLVTGWLDGSLLDPDTPQWPHAWAEVLVPGAGWRGLDPLNNLLANAHYAASAIGRDWSDCQPLRQAWSQRGPSEEGDSQLVLQVAAQ